MKIAIGKNKEPAHLSRLLVFKQYSARSGLEI